MSTNSTTSNYISKINQNYPTAGQDNSSQGMRDNFKNISLALTSADADINDLNINAVKLSQTNDFGENIIKNATLQDCSTQVFDDTENIRAGDIVIDHRNGGYQKFKVASGSNRFTVSNWPSEQKSGSITLSVTTSSTATTYIDFGALTVVNLSNESLPFLVQGTDPQMFELFNGGDPTTLYIKKINYVGWSKLWNTTSATVLTYVGTPTGALVYETVYNKPVFFNGTTWSDFSGISLF